jgi:YHS domain-containing protein
MKKLKALTAIVMTAAFVTAPLTGFGADKKAEKAKPYPLDKCLVSDEKLDEMGKPYVFVYQGQEIKMCCKSCEKDFKKDPAKYLKKLEAAKKADKK